MPSATVTFHGRLQDLLSRSRRGAPVERTFDGSPGLKDVIESLGVPHTEVATLLVDGHAVGWEHRLRGGEHVDAHAVGEGPGGTARRVAGSPGQDPVARGGIAGAASDVGGPLSTATARPDDPPRFVVDGHLGRLAAYLRALGFDTLYRHDADDAELAAIVERDPARILLSRDVGLLKRRVVRSGALVRADHPHDQLADMATRFALAPLARPFTRCMRCNGVLEPMARAAAQRRVPPRVFAEQVSFRRCPDCKGVFWRGSHHRRLRRLLTTSLPELADPGEDGASPGSG